MFRDLPLGNGGGEQRLLEALRPQGVSVDLRHLDPDQIALLSVRGREPTVADLGDEEPYPAGYNFRRGTGVFILRARLSEDRSWLAACRAPGGPGWGRSSFCFSSLPTIDQTIA